MAENIDIKQLIDGETPFYPQTDIHGLVNNGEYAIDDVPTIDSSNLVTSGGVASELALGAVYDVTAHNGSVQFASLQALLTDSNLNTLIPTNIRRGGMSIKFVCSSDNKYVQYRLMSTAWSNVVSDWQGVDELYDDSIPVETSIKETGKYVSFLDGHVASSNPYRITTPIHLLDGQIIRVYADAASVVSVISLTDEQGTSYTPKVQGQDIIDWYEYAATEDCYVALSYNRNTSLEVNILLSEGYITKTVKTEKIRAEKVETELQNEINDIIGVSTLVETSIKETGKYVSFLDGHVASSNPYRLSEPIQLLENQIIRVYANAANIVSVISLTDEQGTSYTPKIQGQDIDWYEYLATEDCYVALSYNRNTSPNVNIISGSSIVEIARVAVNGERKRAEQVETELQNEIANTFTKNIISAFDNIVCVGDSLTYSQVYISNNSSRQAYNPWSKVLKKICGLDEYSIFAKSGGTSKTIWEQYKDSFAIPASGKTICFIYLGTNNWFEDTLDTSAPEADVATYETSWANDFTGSMCKIIQKFINFGAKICIIRPRAGGIYPEDEVPAGWTLEDTNAVLLKIINRFNCAFVDAAKMHSTDLKYHYYPDLSGSNKLHYNDLGYAFFASCLIKETGNMETEYMKRIIPT